MLQKEQIFQYVNGSKSSAEPKSWQMIATFWHSFNIPYMFK